MDDDVQLMMPRIITRAPSDNIPVHYDVAGYSREPAPVICSPEVDLLFGPMFAGPRPIRPPQNPPAPLLPPSHHHARLDGLLGLTVSISDTTAAANRPPAVVLSQEPQPDLDFDPDVNSQVAPPDMQDTAQPELEGSESVDGSSGFSTPHSALPYGLSLDSRIQQIFEAERSLEMRVKQSLVRPNLLTTPTPQLVTNPMESSQALFDSARFTESVALTASVDLPSPPIVNFLVPEESALESTASLTVAPVEESLSQQLFVGAAVGDSLPTQLPDFATENVNLRSQQLDVVNSSDAPTQLPDIGSSDAPTQLPDIGSSDAPTQLPDIGSSDTPTQLPDIGRSSDAPTQQLDFDAVMPRDGSATLLPQQPVHEVGCFPTPQPSLAPQNSSAESQQHDAVNVCEVSQQSGFDAVNVFASSQQPDMGSEDESLSPTLQPVEDGVLQDGQSPAGLHPSPQPGISICARARQLLVSVKSLLRQPSDAPGYDSEVLEDVHLRDALARRQQPPAAPPAVAPPPVGADDTDAAPDRALSPVLIGSSSSLEDLSTLAFASSANRAAGLNFARAKTWPEYDKKAHRATDAPLAPIDSQEDVSTDDEALPLAKADTVVRDMEMDEGKDEAEPRKQDAAQVDEEEEEDVVEVVLEKAVLSPTRPVSPWIPVKRAVPAPSPPPPPPTPPTRPKSSLSLKRARAATPSSHTPASHTLLDQWCKKKT